MFQRTILQLLEKRLDEVQAVNITQKENVIKFTEVVLPPQPSFSSACTKTTELNLLIILLHNVSVF